MRFINTVLIVVLLSSTCWAADKPPAEMTPEELAAAIQGAVEREQYEELIAVAWENYPYHPALAPYTFRDAYFAGDLERALEVIEEVRKTEPDNAEWISSRAILLFDLERFAEAEDAVREALDVGALSPIANVYLGYIELTKDDPDLGRAKEYYELGLADVQAGQEGELLGSFYDLASVYARLGELDAAFENLERVLNIDPAFIEEAAEDPNLENLRDDSRYEGLAAKAYEDLAEFTATYATVPPGEPAPEFVLVDTDGDAVMLSDYAGKVVLINVWATWCPPCRVEIPDIAELYDEYKGNGFVVLGISLDEIDEEFTVDDLAAASAELGVNYPVLLGTESVAEAYISKAGGIPETYIVGPDGIVKDFVYGMTDRDTLERKILKYLP
jgi:cytochrome c biogenesis protein CcmG/thiol:disulfide interchange protein DsbE